jgi:4'-phosphopantetheinyl transferase
MISQKENGAGPSVFKRRSLPLGKLAIPPPGTVHLWFLDFDRLGNPLQGDEQAPASTLNARQARALRRFYLRLLLGAYLGVPGKDVEIARRVSGKPVLAGAAAGSGLDFSNANSPGCCLVGIAAGAPVGVDLEVAGRRVQDPLSLARRYFSAAEAREMAALAPERLDEAFLRAWACKEAVVKAAGHGIANRLNRFSVSCVPGEPPAVRSMDDDDPGAWRLAMVQPSERHVGSIALRQTALSLEAFRLDAPGKR